MVLVLICIDQIIVSNCSVIAWPGDWINICRFASYFCWILLHLAGDVPSLTCFSCVAGKGAAISRSATATLQSRCHGGHGHPKRPGSQQCCKKTWDKSWYVGKVELAAKRRIQNPMLCVKAPKLIWSREKSKHQHKEWRIIVIKTAKLDGVGFAKDSTSLAGGYP